MSSLLSNYQEAGKSKIKNVKGPKAGRLLEMGLTPGTPIEIVRSAPLGFPLEVKVKGYLLTLRKSEAECIEVE